MAINVGVHHNDRFLLGTGRTRTYFSIKLLLLYLVKINKMTPSPTCRVHLKACKIIWDYKIIGENNSRSILRVYERRQGNVTIF